MPVDMQRAPKIPPSKPASDLDRVEIEVVDDGSYIVTCYNKPSAAASKGNMAMIMGDAPKRYTFQNAQQATGFVTAKLEGRPTTAKPDEAPAAAPPAPDAAGPPVDEEEPDYEAEEA